MIFGFKRITANHIDTIQVPQFKGAIGMVSCPGVRFSSKESKNIRKRVAADIGAFKDWGATGVVTLLEEHELSIAKVPDLGNKLSECDIWWRHLPIMDMYIPESEFENNWITEGDRIRQGLKRGERIILHCLAGWGRTGMIAARLLVEFGIPPEMAIKLVRADNKRRIQTREQADFVRNLEV